MPFMCLCYFLQTFKASKEKCGLMRKMKSYNSFPSMLFLAILNENEEAATRCYLHFEIILEATYVVVPNTFVLQVALGLVLSDFKF